MCDQSIMFQGVPHSLRYMRGTQGLLRNQYLHDLGLVDMWVEREVAEDTPSYTLVPRYEEVASSLEKSGRRAHTSGTNAVGTWTHG